MYGVPLFSGSGTATDVYVAVAGEARLSCEHSYSVQIVIVHDIRDARSHIALRLRCRYDWRESLHIKKWCAIARESVSIM